MKKENSFNSVLNPIIAAQKFMHNRKFNYSSIQNKYLQFGDSMSFCIPKSNDFITSDGFIDNHCLLKEYVPQNYGECIFKFVPQMRYDQEEILNKKLEEKGELGATEERIYELGDEELIALYQRYQSEKKDNEKELYHWEGQNIKYGKTLQLIHVKSGKFLTVTNKDVSILEKQNFSIVLDDEGSQGSKFVVSSRYKIRSEGEDIHTGDQVLLINKQYGLYLHLSKKRNTVGFKEINASLDPTIWGMVPFSPFLKSTESDYICAGDAVQLFYIESERVLKRTNKRRMLSDPKIESTSHSLDLMLELEKASENNSNSYWLIENVDVHLGGKLSYGNQIRFRHIATSEYLAMRFEKYVSVHSENNSPRGHRGSFSLYTTFEPNDESVFTFQSLHPEHKDDAYIRGGSLAWHLLIKNVVHKNYLAPHFEERDVKSITFTVYEETHRDDINSFCLLMIPREDLTYVYESLGEVRTIEKYLNLISLPRSSSARDAIPKVARTTCSKLKILLETCLEKKYQDILREQNIFGILIDIIKFTFNEEFGISIKNIDDPINFSIVSICKLSFQIMGNLISENLKNREVLSKEFNFIKEYVEVFSEASETLFELLRNNPTILQNITKEECLFFIDQLKKDGKINYDSPYINIFSILCICEGEPIPENQVILAGHFLESDEFFIPILLKDGIIHVNSSSDGVITLDDFIIKSSESVLNYLAVSIQFLADACFGKNKKAIKLVGEKLSFEVVISCVKDKNLPDILRIAFCDLLHNLYISTNKVKEKRISLTKIWSRLTEDKEPAEISTEYQEVKVMIKSFLSTIAGQEIKELPNVRFIHSLIKLVNSLFSFGFYSTKEEIEDILPYLIRIIEYFPKKKSSVKEKNSVLAEEEKRNKQLDSLKHQICVVLDLIIEIRLDIRVNSLMYLSKKSFEESKIKFEQPEKGIVETIRNTTEMLSFEKHQEWKTQSLSSTLQRLIKSKNSNLSSLSAKLFINYYNQKSNIITSLKNIQILLSDSSVETYKDVVKKIDTLKNFVGSEDYSTAVDSVFEVLENFINHCTSEVDKVSNQNIMCNMRVHEATIDILSNRYSDLEKSVENKLISKCLEFLVEFVRKNRTNQEILYKKVDFFLNPKFLLIEAGSNLVSEIFRNNSFCCTQVTERQIQAVINVIAAGNKLPRLLSILTIIQSVNGKLNRRNQNLVMKLFLQKGNQVLTLFNDPESKIKRNNLIKQEEYKEENSLLNYYNAQLDMIITCITGKIFETEIKAQGLYSLDDFCDHLTDPVNMRETKSRMIMFLLESFFESERMYEGVEYEPSIWRIYEYFNDEISLMLESGEISQDLQNMNFTFFVLIRKYFEKYFSPDTAEKDQTLIVKKMADLMFRVYESHKFENHPKYNYLMLALKEILKRLKGYVDDWEKKSQIVAEYLKESKNIKIENKDNKEKILAKDVNIYFEKYTKLVEDSFDIQKEIDILADTFEANLDTGLVKVLVQLVTKTEDLLEDDKLVVNVLRSLNKILYRKSNDEEKEEELIAIQKKLSKLELVPMFCKLIASDQDSIVNETFVLAISVLSGGNEEVQEQILKHMKKNLDADWFLNMKNTIRKTSLEIKDLQSLTERETLAFMEEKIKFYSSFLENLFRFLQLLCEGHFSGLQNYLRVQTENNKSIDLIYETVNCIESFTEQHITDDVIPSVIQMYTSLTEFIQGPCADNQLSLISTKLSERSNKVLSFTFPNLKDQDLVMTLHEETILTLLSLLEGMSSPLIAEHLINTLDFKLLRKNLDNLCTNPKKYKKLSHRYFVLMKTLMDFERENKLENKVKLEKCQGYKELNDKTGTIEILRNEKLERVYFPIPNRYREKKVSTQIDLHDSRKKQIIYSANRTTQQQKIEDFFKQAAQLQQEIDHHETLEKNPIYSKFIENFNVMTNFSFFVAIIINLFCVSFYYVPPSNSLVEGKEVVMDAFAYQIAYFLCLVQFGVSSIILFTQVLSTWKSVIMRRWSENKDDEEEQEEQQEQEQQEDEQKKDGGELKKKREPTVKELDQKAIRKGRFPKSTKARLISLYYILADPYILYRILYFLTALASVTLSHGPLFIVFHLFDVVIKSSLLKYVLKSVTENWLQLVLTALLAIVVVYIYAILGFVFFRERFERDDGEIICESLLMCLVTIVNEGLRQGGGVGDILKAPKWKEHNVAARIIYDATFFFLVIVILLNIIFGIIIDTFGELRSQAQAIEEDIENVCFVCGVERHRFDNEASGFEKHIKEDHNIWYYMYFIVHLKKTPDTEYTGPESYVREMYDKNQLDWVPALAALCLEKEEPKDKLQLLEEEFLKLKNEIILNREFVKEEFSKLKSPPSLPSSSSGSSSSSSDLELRPHPSPYEVHPPSEKPTSLRSRLSSHLHPTKGTTGTNTTPTTLHLNLNQNHPSPTITTPTTTITTPTNQETPKQISSLEKLAKEFWTENFHNQLLVPWSSFSSFFSLLFQKSLSIDKSESDLIVNGLKPRLDLYLDNTNPQKFAGLLGDLSLPLFLEKEYKDYQQHKN